MKSDVRHLLAGYATGTLTETEKKALFEAALHDPELFAEIAHEEPLRELLASPVARAELLERVEPAEPGFLERLAGWMRRPAVLSTAGVLAAGVALVAIVPAIRDIGSRPQMVAGVVSPARGSGSAPAAPEPEPPTGVEPAAEPSKQPAAARETPARKSSNAAANSVATGHLGGAIGIAQVATAEQPAPNGQNRPARVYAPGQALDAGAVKSFAAPPAAVAPTMVAMAPPPPAPVAAAKAMALRERAVAPPLRYDVETRGPTGEFTAVANASELKDGDVVRVRFRPSMPGLITVRDSSVGAGEPIFTRLVSPSSEVVTEPIAMDRDRTLEVVFTRLDEQASDSARAGQAVEVAPTAPATSALHATAPARAHLLGSPAADASGRVAFAIELRRKP